MNNEKGSGIPFHRIVTIAIFSSIIIGNALGNKSDPTETNNETGLFEPGEHVVSIPVDDITKEITVYEGHVGYKPIGMDVYSLSKEKNDSARMVFVNTTKVQAPITGIDEKGNTLYEDFGTPVDYTIELSENEYDIGQHIITVPFDYDDKSSIEYYDGYNIAAITRAYFGESNDNDGCILYANDELVEYVYDETNNTYFGTPIEKAKVLEK